MVHIVGEQPFNIVEGGWYGFFGVHFLSYFAAAEFFFRDIIFFLQKQSFLRHKCFQNIFFCPCWRQKKKIPSNMLTEKKIPRKTIAPPPSFKLNGCSLMYVFVFIMKGSDAMCTDSFLISYK